jgi:hypothetical protein
MSVYHTMGYMTVYQLVRTFQKLKTRAVSYANACAFRNPPRGTSQDSNAAWANRWLAAYRRYDTLPVGSHEPRKPDPESGPDPIL